LIKQAENQPKNILAKNFKTNNKMETRHIKFDYEEALDAKKQILTTELGLLHTIKRLKAYRLLRKKELALKNQLKTEFGSLKIKLDLIQSTFPEDEKKSKFKNRERKVENKESRNLQAELDDIKMKLERLG